MSDRYSTVPRTATGVLILTSILSILFAVLWLRERQQGPKEVVREVEKPVEVIKEVPVETIREIPKEVIKEVKVREELTDEQKAAIEIYKRLASARRLGVTGEVFSNVKEFRVLLALSSEIKNIISEERVKNKFELMLRGHNINITDDAEMWLVVDINGFWNEAKTQLTYRYSVSAMEDVFLARGDSFAKIVATIWENGNFGYAGRNVAEKTILENVEAMGESFANNYLANQKRDAGK